MLHLPWRVKVMDCSSFSSSSVRVRLRCAATLGRDIVAMKYGLIETAIEYRPELWGWQMDYDGASEI